MIDWERKYIEALANKSLTMEIVEGCILGRGAHIASREHIETVGMFDENPPEGAPDIAAGLETLSKQLTNIGVGGDFRILNWVVEEALEYAADSRCAPSRARADMMVERARTLLNFAETELEARYGVSNALTEQWDIVNEPLPNCRYPLDEID